MIRRYLVERALHPKPRTVIHLCPGSPDALAALVGSALALRHPMTIWDPDGPLRICSVVREGETPLELELRAADWGALRGEVTRLRLDDLTAWFRERPPEEGRAGAL